jgi:F-type H+-transporting ATPase subunit b
MGMKNKGRNMDFRKTGIQAGTIVFILNITSSQLFASSGGGAEDHVPVFGMDMVYSIINFVLLVALFIYLYRKNASGAFAKRSLDVKLEMEEAAEAKRKAEAKYQEYQSRINNLDKEIGAIRALTSEDAAKDRELILDEARKQAERMVEQAELTAKQEIESAKRELRREAADLATGMAEERVRKSTTAEDQKNWVTSYIEKIGETR